VSFFVLALLIDHLILSNLGIRLTRHLSVTVLFDVFSSRADELGCGVVLGSKSSNFPSISVLDLSLCEPETGFELAGLVGLLRTLRPGCSSEFDKQTNHCKQS